MLFKHFKTICIFVVLFVTIQFFASSIGSCIAQDNTDNQIQDAKYFSPINFCRFVAKKYNVDHNSLYEISFGNRDIYIKSLFSDTRQVIKLLYDLGYHIGVYSEGVRYFQQNKINYSGLNKYIINKHRYIFKNKTLELAIQKLPSQSIVIDDKIETLEKIYKLRKDIELILINRKNVSFNKILKKYKTISKIGELVNILKMNRNKKNMKVIKFGHCCLLIEDKNTKLLTDPGEWNNSPEALTGLDAVLITHEHSDHLHVESLKKLLENNPDLIVYCNKSVSKILSEQSIPHNVLTNQEALKINDLQVKAFENLHTLIYSGVPQALNTSYIIGDRLLIPGDSFFEPNIPIDILALPVAGPWLKLSESINYAKKIHPKITFPIHDGMLKFLGSTYKLPEAKLKEVGIKFIALNSGETIDLENLE